MNDLYELVYVSDARFAGDDTNQDKVETELRAILAASRNNNGQDGITGALLYTGRHFAQVIEGPKAAIRSLFDRICADPRHQNVTPLIYRPADQRRFSDWSMTLCTAGSSDKTADTFTPTSVAESVTGRETGGDIVNLLIHSLHGEDARVSVFE